MDRASAKTECGVGPTWNVKNNQFCGTLNGIYIYSNPPDKQNFDQNLQFQKRG